MKNIWSFFRFWINHVRIPCMVHCILMVFRQGTRYFLKCSIKRNSRAFVFFMELPPPLAQPPLSHHQPPLSPTTVTTTTITTTTTDESFIFTSSTFIFVEGSLARKLHFHIFYVQFLREVSHESFIFTSSTFNFWGKFCAKASFSHLPLSVFQWTHRRKASEPCTCLALACCSWRSNVAPRTTAFSHGPRLADRDWCDFLAIVSLSFGFTSFGTPGWIQENHAKQWFWETLPRFEIS